jgi:hypothetical protein
MSPPERSSRSPTHDETAADVADSATAVGPMPVPARRLAARAFWWLAHHLVARPLAIAFPVRHTSRFSAWTLDRRNM